MKIFAAALALSFIAAPAFAQESAKALQDAFAAAVEAEDADALAALYTEDALSYGPGGDVSKGRAAIAASWTPFFSAYDDISVTLDQQGEVANKKNHAAWGIWSMTMKSAETGESVTMKGRFTDVSLKTKDGWKYVNDHASSMAE